MLDRYTDTAQRVIHKALREALQLGHRYVDTPHILLALLREPDPHTLATLTKLDTTPDQVRRAVLTVLIEQPLTDAPGTTPCLDAHTQLQADITALEARVTALEDKHRL